MVGEVVAVVVGVALGSWLWDFSLIDSSMMSVLGLPFFVYLSFEERFGYWLDFGGHWLEYVGPIGLLALVGNFLVGMMIPQILLAAWLRRGQRHVSE
jgi:hypothetical protein